MRVIGGSCRGRVLRAPPGTGTRPTTDRVREAMFDVLGSQLGPDGLVGASVVDLFAGSGALGIEALSRGARSATFVDADARAVRVVRRNLSQLGLDGPDVDVVRADVLSWLAGAGSGRRFTVALCDPPYAFDRWPELLRQLDAAVLLAESDRPLAVGEPWIALKEKRYGGTLVTVARTAAPWAP